MGGGAGLTMHGTFRVATEFTQFAMPEVAIGLFPDVGSGFILPKLKPAGLGNYLGLTAARLKGVETVLSGVATHVCERERLADLENELVNCSTKSEIETLLDHVQRESTLNCEELKQDFSFRQNLRVINKCFQQTTLEEILSCLETSRNPWAIEQAKIIRSYPVTSLKITLEQLKRGKTMSLEEVLAMEWVMVRECCLRKDFFEGVRAKIVDKTNDPKWQLEFDGEISDYFQQSPWTPES